MKRGEVWVATRLGRDRLLAIVGNDALLGTRPGVLTVPISDIATPLTVTEPYVSDETGAKLGVAQTPHVGAVNQEYLKTCVGVLAPKSVEDINTALRAALGL